MLFSTPFLSVEIDRALARLERRDTGFAAALSIGQKKWKRSGFSWRRLHWWRSRRSRRNVIQVARGLRQSEGVSMSSHKSLPYRPCAGMMVFNNAGLIFIGRRTEGPEHLDATHVWQMPQGGSDKDEDPYKAALRELNEEPNIRSVQKLAEIAD